MLLNDKADYHWLHKQGETDLNLTRGTRLWIELSVVQTLLEGLLGRSLLS